MHIREAYIADYPALMTIWEGAVLTTHDFLATEDFELFKRLIPTEFLPQLRVFIIEDNKNKAQAFFSVSDDNLEMLFVAPTCRGKGYGKTAVDYVIQELQVRKVDVNEQNEQALGFYLKAGYKQVGRSEKDGMGKNYPLIHLEIPT
ncbi:GNAT family N-acetyltransferase [Sphingobacterium sp. MYb382]|uniref:GNAT family N-acetyltransferase n=1 Tax=Sphingobacterium sp. MYb382 TaxID=2745278 RepID=UPI0030A8B99A